MYTHKHPYASMYAHTNPVFQRAQLPEQHRWRTATWRADPDSPPRQTHYTDTQVYIYTAYDTKKTHRKDTHTCKQIEATVGSLHSFNVLMWLNHLTRTYHLGIWIEIMRFMLDFRLRCCTIIPEFRSFPNHSHNLLKLCWISQIFRVRGDSDVPEKTRWWQNHKT